MDLAPQGEVEKSSALNAVIPLVTLVVGVLICDKDMIHGLVLALLASW